MDMCEITVVVTSEASSVRRLAIAVDLARRFSASGGNGTHVTGIGILVPPAVGNAPLTSGVEGSGSIVGGGLFAAPLAGISDLSASSDAPGATSDDLADVASSEQRFLAATKGLLADWRVVGHGSTDEMIRYARLSDLTIFGQVDPTLGSTEMGFQPDEVLVEAGTPALIIPYAGTFSSIGRRVLIAWDGSREAARALHDALPLLRTAEAVTVIDVGYGERQTGTSAAPPDYVVGYLTYHGIEAFVDPSITRDISVANVLLSRCVDLEIDLLVAGCFHHSRLRESLLGGVTRDLLKSMTVPVLMAH